MTTIPRFKIVWAGTPNQTKGIAIVNVFAPSLEQKFVFDVHKRRMIW